MICISFRRARSDRLSSIVTFFCSNHTSPEVGSINLRMDRPVVDLPQPDSPTRPSVSPRMMSNDTSSTACTRATSRERRPPRIGKYFRRLRTRRRDSAIVALLSRGSRPFLARPHFPERPRGLVGLGLYETATRPEPANPPHPAPPRRQPAPKRVELSALG